MAITADLRRAGPQEALSLPWAEWTHVAPGARVMVYTDASHHETTRVRERGQG